MAAMLYRTRTCSDGYTWRCLPCLFHRTVRAGSLLQRSHLELKSIILMMYCWAVDQLQTLISREAEVPEGLTLVDWCNFFRDEAAKYVDNRLHEIGGMDDNNQPLVVEIDEKKYFHRKYHPIVISSCPLRRAGRLPLHR